MTMNEKADEALLAALHGILTEELIHRVKTHTATPSDLNVARQLLKDNGISCDGPRNERMNSLLENMPEEFTEFEQ